MLNDMRLFSQRWSSPLVRVPPAEPERKDLLLLKSVAARVALRGMRAAAGGMGGAATGLLGAVVHRAHVGRIGRIGRVGLVGAGG